MAMSKAIKIAMAKRGLNQKDLADRIGWSPQNLSGKMRRDNFTESDLENIAAALDCHFEGRFIRNDNGQEL